MFALYPFKSGIGMKKKEITTHVSEQQFLALLRAGLWGQPVEMTYFPENGTPEWKGILYLGKTQAVLPLIYDGMLGLPAGMQLKGPALMKLIAYVDKIEKLNMELNDAVSEISARLSAAGIRSVLLKGQGLAALYPNPLRRQCGDIDLYVGEENYRKAAEIIRGWSEVCEGSAEKDKHIGFMFHDLVLELHRHAFSMPGFRLSRIYKTMELKELSLHGQKIRLSTPSAEIGGKDIDSIIIPSEQFNVFYTFCHAFFHFMLNGLGLRQMCDIAVLLHNYHDKIDVENFKTWLKKFKMDHEWELFINLIVNYIGLPQEETLLYNKNDHSSVLLRQFLETIFDDGNFGQYKSLPDYSHYPFLLKKAGSLINHHILLFRRFKFSKRQTLRYYFHLWYIGIFAFAHEV